MMNQAQREVVSAFCKRVTALDGETGEGSEGRCQWKSGPKLSRSKITLDSIAFSPETKPGDLADRLIQQFEELSRDGEHARLYLVCYLTGATAPLTSERFDIDDAGPLGADPMEPADIDWNGGAAALFGALGTGYERMTRSILTEKQELHAMVMHMVDRVMDLQIRVVRAEYEARDAAGLGMAQALSEISERAMPLLAQIAPHAAAGIGAYLAAKAAESHANAAKARGESGPPSEPADATAYHVTQLQARLMQMATHFQKHPETLTDAVKTQIQQTFQMAQAAAAQWMPPEPEPEGGAA